MDGSLRRTRLAGELKRLREDQGLSLEQVTARTDVKRTSLSRIENASQKAKPPIVRVLLDAYGVSGEQAESLLQLAREADQRGWWSAHTDTLTAQHLEYISFEAKASGVQNYEPAMVPGLLQTLGYARAMIRGAIAVDLPDDAVERQAAIRIERQRRLTEGDAPLSLWAIVDESALRRPVGGPDTMREQLAHLEAMSRWPTVTLQVIGNEIGAHVGMVGSFSILDFASHYEPPAVYVDCPAGQLWVEGEEALERATMTFNRLRGTALDEETSRRRIRQASKELPP